MKTTLITFFDIKGTVHFELIPTVNQAYYVELLKRLREAVHRKKPELWPNDRVLQHDNAPAHKALPIKHFLAPKSITEMGHPHYTPDLAPNDFCLKGQRFQDTEDIQKECDDGTESNSTTGVPKMFATVAVSLG
jgi:hypothetical protein